MNEQSTLISVNMIRQIEYIPECANLFYRAKKAENLSPATLEFYKKQLAHFLKYCEGQAIEKMVDLTSANIREFLLWHESTGHNPGGLHAAYRSVKAFLRWYDLEAEPDNWKNPILKVKAPRVPKAILEPAHIEDIERLLAACNKKNLLDTRDRAMLLFLLDTGVRAREFTSIDLVDVNYVSGEISIHHGKGSKERTVFIGKRARKALRAYLKLRRTSEPGLWLSDDNERLSYRGLDGILKRRSTQAGITPQTLHSFRRAFAINMLRAGTDLITLARLMGHADLTILQRYLKQIPDDLRIAHAKGSPADNLL